jgi:hypothetical protein
MGTLRNSPEERSSHLLRGGKLKLRILQHYGEISWILDSWAWNHQVVSEKSVTNYNYALRNSSEKSSFQHTLGVRQHSYSLHEGTWRKQP